MPEKRTLERARMDKKRGKAATTQAGEFVREEMDHAKSGKHPVKNRKQAIAIGLSKARRAGVKLPSPPDKTRSTGGGSKHSNTAKSRSTRSKKSARSRTTQSRTKSGAGSRARKRKTGGRK